MTTITTDRARLEELLGEYWEIAFEESSGVVAIGNKANRVLHEIRALFNKLEAENQRLRIESEERLQNCAALVAENERLRKEAERYQWLRGDSCHDHSVRWVRWEVRCWKAPFWTADLRREELDAAIGAAMKGEKP